MLDDLELAANAIRADEMSSSRAWHLPEREDWKERLDTLRDLIQNEPQVRQRLGDNWYKAYFKFARWSAQQALLDQAGVDIPLLSLIYGSAHGVSVRKPGGRHVVFEHPAVAEPVSVLARRHQAGVCPPHCHVH